VSVHQIEDTAFFRLPAYCFPDIFAAKIIMLQSYNLGKTLKQKMQIVTNKLLKMNIYV